MRRLRILAPMLLLVSLLSWRCTAGEGSESMEADVRTLMQVSGIDSIQVQMTNYMVNATVNMIRGSTPDAPDSVVWIVKEEMKRLMVEKMPELIQRCEPISEKHYTHAEVKQLIAFYRSPLGQKLRREAPQVTLECAAVGEEWGRSLQPELAARLEARFPDSESEKH